MSKQLVDFMSQEDYDRYNELLGIATTNKANAPKVVKPRGPMSQEQKVKMAQARIAKAQAALDALLNSEN